ncbi:MAG: 3-hydroxyanthranilate 3,4-dioxygenase [Bacteriovoracaceae bacterium]|jgi:3-hydroxyanthranilate 3,4-dioxygenase|nr:3-hydroxyanthranilate 3,4-dioxygenase [Bacteriovoracaceae bacterium]
MSTCIPINFKNWINDHREFLKPPVGNKMVWKEGGFIVMVVGGPNARQDYHINETDEFFYQVEGNMVLKTRNDHGKIVDVPINEGEIYLLSGGVPHSPQREANSVGLVIEKTRVPEDKDSLVWYCEGCDSVLYSETFYLSNIETQLKECFDRYFGDEKNYTCKKCGRVNPKA